MTRNGKEPDKPGGGLSGRRLKELAQEASRHLDQVLPGGEPKRAAGSPRSETGAVGPPGRAATARGRVAATPREGPSESPAEGPRSQLPRALVAHVSPGIARILANLLNHMGLRAHVADSPAEVESLLGSGRWDVVFVQGTAMPYPGKRLLAAAMGHCIGTGIPVILLTRPGDELVAEAAECSALGLLEWPFGAESVRRALAAAVPRAGGSPDKRDGG